jgi:hypothetical protein
MAAKKGRKGPTGVNIRVYDVGFGDCFLLTFQYASGKRHVLIDFGSTAAARKGVSLSMDIARNIAEATDGTLHAVVATHRHQDHISGFTTKSGKGTGDIIRKLAKNAVIVQPWTEDPKLARNATGPVSSKKKSTSPKSLAISQLRSLEAMHDVAKVIATRAQKIDTGDVTAESSSGPAPAPLFLGEINREKLSFLGQTNLKNPEAVKNLMTMSTPKKRHYVSFGGKSGLEDVLPGVKVEVLGPPTVDQYKEVLKERREDQAEFWMLAASATKMTTSAHKPLFPNEPYVSGDAAPRRVRRFIRRVRGIHAQQLFELVRIVDDAMNNTSVILLFTIGKTRLLFPGDAQIENWEYALKKSKRAAQILAKLEQVNVYKVGHHGSRNATPKTLWRHFKNKRKGLQTVMSTKSGKFPGRAGSGTEVPRQSLFDVLVKQSELTNTQDIPGTKKDFFRDLPVPLQK